MEIVISKSESTSEGTVPVSIMQLRGALDGHTYEQFIHEAQQLFDSGARDLLLDMTNLTFLSSAGIAALHRMARIYRGEKSTTLDQGWSAMRTIANDRDTGFTFQRHIKLLNPNEKIEDVLDTVGFKAFFEIFTDEAAAVASFQ
jgi:anti-anti-sigma factor